jgi:deoxyadenosine/deoxycytidine kinase
MVHVFSIEGNIGAGKSTLVNVLKTKLTEISIVGQFYGSTEYNLVYLQEPVDAWQSIKDSQGVNIIEKYYSNQEKYAFPFQMMAFISRYTQLKNAIKNAHKNTIIITERCLLTDHEVFAKMLYDSSKIDEISYNIYKKWFDEFEIMMTGIIYIDVNYGQCDLHIKNRNRPGENIPLSYLEECEKYHHKWIENVRNKLILILDDQEYWPRQIEKFISSLI